MKRDLFVVSALVLFLELACIRWFPAHVLFLTFFTNVILLAAFLGISIGCLAASWKRSLLALTPVLLIIAMGTAHYIEVYRQRTGRSIEVGDHQSPQLLFFGVETQPWDPSKFPIPIEAVSAVMFVLVALLLAGPGQQLGRALARVPDRLTAYTINVAGSLAGILFFTWCSWREIGPAWWFGGILLAVLYFLAPADRTRALALSAVPLVPLAIFFLASSRFSIFNWMQVAGSEFWSPYYRVHYQPDSRFINVNLIGHQVMVPRRDFSPAYALPHLLRRDSGPRPFNSVLVIGAGSGNDVSRALEWGARHVDAVEIDPVIQRIGRRDHPDQPYADGRVTPILNDGRNFLRRTTATYDLVVYALVDSLVLQSSYSNIRLESYLFTKDAFADVRSRLGPDGVFVIYNFFRQGWIVARLYSMLEATFGAGNPVVFTLPARPEVHPEDVRFTEFTVMMAGATQPIKDAFARTGSYWIPADRPTDTATPNGFEAARPEARTEVRPDNGPAGGRKWIEFMPATIHQPAEPLRLPTDAWPFLYLKGPMIPALNLRGMAIMGGLGAVMLLPFLFRGRGAAGGAHDPPAFLTQMFFLGAGFMLVETKAVVQMALLFGGTWIVNSVVFCAVLAMILAANIYVFAVRPSRLTVYYAGLILSLVVSALVPMDAFLGLPQAAQIAGSCALAFTPIFFAGVVFAVSFRRSLDPDRAFGANIAGALVGGLSEYSSMLLGFQLIVLVAVVFYLLSFAGARRAAAGSRLTA